MKRGFTLIEMLVVIGILAALMTAGVVTYSSSIRQAQTARGAELVHNFQTALVMSLQKEDCWLPDLLKYGAGSDGQAVKEVGACLGKRHYFSFGADDDGDGRYRLSAAEEFGVLTPWAEEFVRTRLASNAQAADSLRMPSGGTIGDHRLRFAIDSDYDGITVVSVSASGQRGSTKVRASACVWCCGYDGKFGTKDDIYSWTVGQETK